MEKRQPRVEFRGRRGAWSHLLEGGNEESDAIQPQGLDTSMAPSPLEPAGPSATTIDTLAGLPYSQCSKPGDNLGHGPCRAPLRAVAGARQLPGCVVRLSRTKRDPLAGCGEPILRLLLLYVAYDKRAPGSFLAFWATLPAVYVRPRALVREPDSSLWWGISVAHAVS